MPRPASRVSQLTRATHASPLLPVLHRGADKVAEQRMRIRCAGSQLRMELRADEPGMISQLDDLDKVVRGANARHDHPVLLECFLERIVDFVPVPVTFGDKLLFVGPEGFCSLED